MCALTIRPPRTVTSTCTGPYCVSTTPPAATTELLLGVAVLRCGAGGLLERGEGETLGRRGRRGGRLRGRRGRRHGPAPAAAGLCRRRVPRLLRADRGRSHAGRMGPHTRPERHGDDCRGRHRHQLSGPAPHAHSPLTTRTVPDATAPQATRSPPRQRTPRPSTDPARRHTRRTARFRARPGAGHPRRTTT